MRDPLDRFISALSELDKRGELHVPINNRTIDNVLHLIYSHGFHNSHLWPAALFLIDPLQAGYVKLPVDFVGTTEHSGPTLAWLRARLESSDASLSPAAWLRATGGKYDDDETRSNTATDGEHVNTHVVLKPTVEQAHVQPG